MDSQSQQESLIVLFVHVRNEVRDQGGNGRNTAGG